MASHRKIGSWQCRSSDVLRFLVHERGLTPPIILLALQRVLAPLIDGIPRSCGTQPGDEPGKPRITSLDPPAQQIAQLIVCHMEKPVEICNVVLGQRSGGGIEKA